MLVSPIRSSACDAEAHKVAFRSHPLAKLHMGNQDVYRRGRRADGLFVAHYPWRSFEQMAGKLRHGRRAMEATDMPPELCYHWRVGGTWSDESLGGVWDDLCLGKPIEDLAWSPIGQLRTASPGTARTWSDVMDASDAPPLGLGA